MAEPGESPTALEVVEELNALFDDTDFKSVRTTLEEQASNEEARQSLGGFQDYLERAVDPDLVIDYSELGPEHVAPGSSRLYRGWEGWLEHWRTWFEAWDAIEVDERNLEEIDSERVLIWSVGKVRGRGSGAELPWTSAFVIWTVRDGKVIRLDGFSSRDEALAAVG